MVSRFRAAGLLWPTVLAACALAVLISLGTWQWRRLEWKASLIGQIKARETLTPIPLAQAWAIYEKARSDPKRDPNAAVRFLRVRLTGVFAHDKEIHLWAGQPSGPAWMVLTPLKLAEPLDKGSRYPLQRVIVMRGIVPQARKGQAKRPGGQVKGPVTIVGRIRIDPGPNWAADAPNLERNEWYARDLRAMRHHLAGKLAGGSSTAEDWIDAFVPFAVEAEQPTGGPAAPQPDLKALQISNRHLEYVITWYGIALTLIGVYIAFAMGRLRRQGREPDRV